MTQFPNRNIKTASLGELNVSKDCINEKLIAQFWILAFRLQVRTWFEYVDSKGNWSDGISRLFDRDEFAEGEGFRTKELEEPLRWLRQDAVEAWHTSTDW